MGQVFQRIIPEGEIEAKRLCLVPLDEATNELGHLEPRDVDVCRLGFVGFDFLSKIQGGLDNEALNSLEQNWQLVDSTIDQFPCGENPMKRRGDYEILSEMLRTAQQSDFSWFFVSKFPKFRLPILISKLRNVISNIKNDHHQQ